MLRIGIILSILVVLGGCTQFPDLQSDRTVGRDLAFPVLAPLDQLLAPAAARSPQDDPAATLQARAAALRDKANALQAQEF